MLLLNTPFAVFNDLPKRQIEQWVNIGWLTTACLIPPLLRHFVQTWLDLGDLT